MKRLTIVVFFAVVVKGLCASHEGAAQGVTDDLNSLGLYVGVWKAETVMILPLTGGRFLKNKSRYANIS